MSVKKASRMVQPKSSWTPEGEGTAHAPRSHGGLSYTSIVKHLVAQGVPQGKAERAALTYAAPDAPTVRMKRVRSPEKKAFDFAALKFKLLCKANGLPVPVTEHKFAAHMQPPRQWRFDFAWVNVDEPGGVALEVEGGIYTNGRHVRGKGYEGDMAKYSTAAAMGWKVIRVSPRALCTDATVELIKQAMEITHA